MSLLPYIGSVINLANSFSQATRPRNVGQMSDLIQKYRSSNLKLSVDGWKQFYDENIGLSKIDLAAGKIWDYTQRIHENLNNLTQDDVYIWTEDLIVNKTFAGLQLQLDILSMVSDNEYRLATLQEEAKGIDGYVDGEPVSIKPHTYKKTIQSGKESIPYRILYYKQTKNGLVIV